MSEMFVEQLLVTSQSKEAELRSIRLSLFPFYLLRPPYQPVPTFVFTS